MIIAAPDFSLERAEKIAKNLGVDSIEIATRVFPNGEVLARLSDTTMVNGNDVLLFHPTYPETNDRLLLLFQSVEALKYYGAKKVMAVIPYLSYSRQDKRFLEGESLSLKLFLDILHVIGVDTLISFDVHNASALKKYAKTKIETLSLYNDIIRYAVESLIGDREFILVAPDKGRLDIVRRLAKSFSCDYTYFIKERDRYTGEIVVKEAGDIEKVDTAIILDDEISSGGTMAKVAKRLKESGVDMVVAAAVHLLLVNNAVDRLYNAGVSYIIGSNTIDNPYSTIEIEDKIASLFT